MCIRVSHPNPPQPQPLSSQKNHQELCWKNNSVYVLAICANFLCKIENFELEVLGAGILGPGFYFQGSH